MILLNSDTETKPTDEMRAVIAAAAVGDEQRNEDPSVNALCEQVAHLLGQQAAIFVPTGTMCNVIAVKTHTQPGDLLLAEASAHVLRAEGGGAAMISGVMTQPISNELPADEASRASSDIVPGTFTVQALEQTIAQASALPQPYRPPPTLVCVEQTHNFSGGSIWPAQALGAVCDFARQQGLRVHMDGARLMNAAVAASVPASDFAGLVDSVWIDFTKGLGAPIGAVLAGPAEFIARAGRFKTAVGGAMRQAGIAAAGCSYALDHHVTRLAEDHTNAQRLAAGLAALPGVRLVHGMPQSNIVFFDVSGSGLSATQFAQQCIAGGVRVGPVAGSVRAVTHLQTTTRDIETALQVMAGVISQAPGAN